MLLEKVDQRPGYFRAKLRAWLFARPGMHRHIGDDELVVHGRCHTFRTERRLFLHREADEGGKPLEQPFQLRDDGHNERLALRSSRHGVQCVHWRVLNVVRYGELITSSCRRDCVRVTGETDSKERVFQSCARRFAMRAKSEPAKNTTAAASAGLEGNDYGGEGDGAISQRG